MPLSASHPLHWAEGCRGRLGGERMGFRDSRTLWQGFSRWVRPGSQREPSRGRGAQHGRGPLANPGFWARLWEASKELRARPGGVEGAWWGGRPIFSLWPGRLWSLPGPAAKEASWNRSQCTSHLGKLRQGLAGSLPLGTPPRPRDGEPGWLGATWQAGADGHVWLDYAPSSNSPCSASNRPDLPGRHHFLKVSRP